jgi:hypothetical protein
MTIPSSSPDKCRRLHAYVQAISFSFLISFAIVTLYQIVTHTTSFELMRLQESGQPPDLSLQAGMQYHTF